MKHIKLLAIVCILFSSCKKENSHSASQNITGQWIWFKSTGGITGITLTPQNTGNTWGLQLHTDGTCSQTGNVLPAQSGTYTLTSENTPQGAIQYLNISYTDHTEKYHYIFITQDTLRLDDHIETDGQTHFFVKM